MNRRERRRFLTPTQRGLVLGPTQRLSPRDSYTNLALVAPTGSGKTTRYVIPNVLQVEGSVVVTDPAGEIFAATAGHLHARGFGIQVLQPADVTGSAGFNPLRHWREPQELRQLAGLLGSELRSGSADPFWSTAAVNLLWIGLAALNRVPAPEFVNLGNLRWLLNHLGDSAGRLDAFMARHLGDDAQVQAEYRAFCAQDPKVSASILSSARAALELWADRDICALTAGDTLDVAALRRRRSALYLIVPEHQVRYFSPLLKLVYSACFAHCLQTGQQPEEHPVYFFLDEFGNLGYLPEFATIITTLRKRRCSVSLILQELSQLRAIYGPDVARTIFSGGCGNKLFFAGLDLETANYVEQALGQNTAYDTTFGGIDAHARTLAVPLLRAEEARRLPPEAAVLISGRQRPARLHLPPYFRVPAWQALTQKEPVTQAARSTAKAFSLLDLGGAGS